MKVSVLDKGYVSLAETNLGTIGISPIMGSDLSPVNAARASFMKASQQLNEADIRLLDFLAREAHTSPYRHATVTIEVKAPFMIARQWFKYRVGWEHGPDTAELVGVAVPKEIAPTVFDFLKAAVQWLPLGADQFREFPITARNEASRRYVTLEPEWYVPGPTEWRSAPENMKQGSGEPLPADKGHALTHMLKVNIQDGMLAYNAAMAQGLAPEMARGFLPSMYFMYTVWRWTASLQGVAFFISERTKHDAQDEITQYAYAVWDLIRPYFKHSLDKLLGENTRG
ncbi:FAD-dependent thymidylate synthase [Brevibacillus fulvus]